MFKLNNRYYIISLISSILVCVSTAAVMLIAPILLEKVLYWTQLGCLLIAFICIMDCLRKDSKNLFLQLQAGAIVCFILGLIFWVAHLTVLGYDSETFSISDLSCLGFYFFLLSAVSGIHIDLKSESKDLLKYKLLSLVAPLLIIISGMIQILFVIENSFGDILFVVLYTAVMTPLSYLSLKLLILPDEPDIRIRAMKPYNFLVIMIILVNNVWNITSFISHGFLFSFCVFLTSILFLGIIPIAYGGDCKWKTY